MPIVTSIPITVPDPAAYDAAEKIATACAYSIQNEIGCYLDERLCQAELAARLEDRKLAVAREVKITLTLGSFTRDYRVDLLVNGGVIIEAKTAETVTPAQRAQVLNSLYLCGLQHATLLNFQSERVHAERISTRLTPQMRRQVVWKMDAWQPLCAGCETFRGVMRSALADWGIWLDPALYRDVVTHGLGGEAQVIREVEVVAEPRSLGTQTVHHLADDIAFFITASVHQPQAVQEHLRRFLAHTRLRAIQWVNLNRQIVSFHTLQK